MGIINAECGKTVSIGYQGENKRQRVRFDLSDIMTEFPGGTAVLGIRRPGDSDIVPALNTALDGMSLIWTTTAWELANSGFLYAQVTYSDGDAVGKTKVYRFDVKNSLIVSGVEPEDWQDLVGQLTSAAAALQAVIESYDEMTAEATTLPAGSDPTAEIDRSGDHPVLRLGLIAGPTGAQGPKGDQGPAGPAGQKGDTGATGARGPAGETGPQGPAGPKGDEGERGETGATGSRGPKGDKGDPGEGVVPVFTRDMTSETPNIYTCNMEWSDVYSAVNNGQCTMCKVVLINPYGQSENYLTFTCVSGDDLDEINFESTLTYNREIRNRKIKFYDDETVVYVYDDFNVPLIDDTAGSGVTGKTWSANKLDSEKSSLMTEINSRYTKPNTGIPATDMAEAVQTSLGKADSAYQKPQTGIPASDMEEGVIPDITGKADKTVTDALQKNKAPVIIDSAEGNPIVLTDGADGLPVESMKIHFLPKQDTSGGDPSPSHVCPISGWSGVTAWRTGANLFDISVFANKQGVTIDGSMFYGYADALSVATSSGVPFYIKKGTKLTTRAVAHRSASDTGAGWCVYFFYADGTQVRPFYTANNVTTPTEYIGTITAEQDIVSYKITYFNNPQTGIWYVDELMIEVGETASPYTEYTGESYPVTFPDGQTVYGGTLDAVNGVLTVGWVKALLDDADAWAQSGSTFLSYAGYSFNDRKTGSSWNLLCPFFPASQASSGTAYIRWGGLEAGNILVAQNGSSLTVDDLKTMSENKEIYIVYPLATTIEIPLSDIPVPAMLKGENTIWSDANGAIELDYRADTKLWISGHSTTVDSALSDTSENPVQNKVIKTALDGKEPLHNTTTVSGATPTITGVENTRYICGECSTLTITAPASGCIDVVFESGSTPTVLTVSSAKTGVTAIKWANGFDPTALEANTTYEINILDGEFGVVGKWT